MTAVLIIKVKTITENKPSGTSVLAELDLSIGPVSFAKACDWLLTASTEIMLNTFYYKLKSTFDIHSEETASYAFANRLGPC